MGVYLAVLSFVLLYYDRLRRGTGAAERRAMAYSLACAGAVALMLGLRHPSMGVDLGYGREYGYLPSFLQLSGMDWEAVFRMEGFQNYEWGYILLNRLLGSVCQWEQGLLLCCGMLSVLPVGWVLGRYSPDCRLSFLIYLGLPAFFICFSGLRQGIALGIAFYGYRYVVQRRWRGFLAAVLVACCFHRTAVVSLLVYPACCVVPDRVGRWLSVVGLGVLFCLREPLWNAVVLITGRGTLAVHNGSVALMLLFWSLYGYLVLFSRQPGLANVQYLACCALVFAEVSTVAQRVGYYFLLYLTVSLPTLVEQVRQRRGPGEARVHWLILAVGFLSLGAYQLFGNSWAMAWPYCFFWQGGGI